MDTTTILMILNLIVGVLTILAQIVQSILDYKRDKLNNNHDKLYDKRQYTCTCCVYEEPSE